MKYLSITLIMHYFTITPFSFNSNWNVDTYYKPTVSWGCWCGGGNIRQWEEDDGWIGKAGQASCNCPAGQQLASFLVPENS